MAQSSCVRDVEEPPDRKGVLFCPSCGHESPVDGDWVVRERVTSLVYRCPECENQITERECHHPIYPAVRLWSRWVRAVATTFFLY